MPLFHPQDLADWTRGRWHLDRCPANVPGFCFDARQLRPGECFVALSGGTRDGHAFVGQAADRGAGCALVEHACSVHGSSDARPGPDDAGRLPQLVVPDSLAAMGAIAAGWRGKFPGAVIGITGSCGKTSTKELLRVLLDENRTHATAGNWNNRIGVPMTLFGLDPDRHEFAVVEAGINQPDEMRELGAMIRGDATIVTNIGPAHLERLHSVESVAAEKAELARLAAPDSPVFMTADTFAYGVFSALSARVTVLAAQGVNVRGRPGAVVRYGRKESAGNRTTLTLNVKGRDHVFVVNTQSVGMCQNAALAVLAALHFGADPEAIQTRIAAWRPPADRGRIAVHRDRNQHFYIDCYNANPASMKDALATFRRALSSDRPRCYVLGAMNELGVHAAEQHREIGAALRLRPEDRAMFVGPPALVDAYRAGALSDGAEAGQLRSAESVQTVKSAIAEFEGAIFLKGSRSYALEKLLPESLRPTN